MGRLREAVEQAFEDLAGTGTLNLPRSVWERVRHVPRARENLIIDVVAGIMIARAMNDGTALEEELSRLR